LNGVHLDAAPVGGGIRLHSSVTDEVCRCAEPNGHHAFRRLEHDAGQDYGLVVQVRFFVIERQVVGAHDRVEVVECVRGLVGSGWPVADLHLRDESGGEVVDLIIRRHRRSSEFGVGVYRLDGAGEDGQAFDAGPECLK
jgi:hypothetical protein